MILSNVTVLDGTGGPPAAGMDVHIADGRFTAISPTDPGRIEPAVGPDLVRGGFLLPGLWEGHTHLTAMSTGVAERQRPAFLAEVLASYVRAGVTSVCELGGPLPSARSMRALGRAQDTAPSLYVAGQSLTGVNGWPLSAVRELGPGAPGPDLAPSLEVDGVDAARRHLGGQLDEIDYVKCILDGQPGRDRLPLDALRAIVVEAHRAGKKVLVHIATSTDLRDAVAAGADCVEHSFLPVDPTDEREAAEAASLLADTGTLLCPTVVTWEQLGRTGDPAYLDELVAAGIVAADDVATITARPSWGRPFPHHPIDASRTRFDHAMRTLHRYHEAGVELVAGSDVALAVAVPAHALLRELQLFSRAGVPAPAVIAAATGHAAKKIGKQTSTGTVAVGSAADAILLDADPLADLTRLTDPRHLRAVIRDGRMIPPGGAASAAARPADEAERRPGSTATSPGCPTQGSRDSASRSR